MTTNRRTQKLERSLSRAAAKLCALRPMTARWVAPALLLTALLGCGTAHSYHLVGSPTAPGADAELEVKPEDGNYAVNLEVHNLLPPGRALEGSKKYAVWVKPKEAASIHIGNLDYKGSDRTGQLQAVTPHRDFTLMVTAEAGSTPAEPGGPVVLQQEVRAH